MSSQKKVSTSKAIEKTITPNRNPQQDRVAVRTWSYSSVPAQNTDSLKGESVNRTR